MEDFDLKRKLNLTATLFLVGIILVWTGFYLHTTIFLKAEREQTIKQISEQIVVDLEAEFLKIEGITFSISQNPAVKEFVQESDILSFHNKAGEIISEIKTLASPSLFIENLVIYGKDEHTFYRFIGNPENIMLIKLYYQLGKSNTSAHIIKGSDNRSYVCYVCEIYDITNRIGSTVIFIGEERIKEKLLSYGVPDTIKIALSSEGTIVAANDTTLIEKEVDLIRETAAYSIRKKIGITPFEIIVLAEQEYLNALGNSIGAAIIMTALLFAFLLLTFFFILNKYYREVSHQKALVLSLKKQINTHFTVNVLSIIRFLAKSRETEKVIEMCDGLSFLLRYSGAEDEFIGVLDEMRILEKYIAIMSIRNKDSFISDFDIDDRLDNYKIPRMLIQPVLENAIMHGFKDISSGGILCVSAQLCDNFIEICIIDNGFGMSEANLQAVCSKMLDARQKKLNTENTKHIALPNIERRIASYYGDGYGLKIESKENSGTKVRIRLGLTRS